MSAADQALLDQIQRLSGALRQARDETAAGGSQPYGGYQYSRGRGRGRYPYSKFVSTRPPPAPVKSVEIGGQMFKASTNKLTRQTDEGKFHIYTQEDGHLWDPNPTTLTNLWNVSSGPSNLAPSATVQAPPQPISKAYIASSRGRFATRGTRGRGYKPRVRRHANLSLVLNKAKNATSRKAKLDKQCPFFSRTGLCSRGKSCRYQHDPEKVAICPRYLAGDCASTAENCLLSHSATLNRVPPCVHFQNHGRCKNGDQCIYPHVRLGVKKSVCRDFAVLGYCEKGIDCEDTHVRECPDFAETGSCKNPKCKLPHVIRANRKHNGKAPVPVPKAEKSKQPQTSDEEVASLVEPVNTTPEDGKTDDSQQQPINGVDFTFEGGDEYIPLTFVESDVDEEEEEEEEEEEDGDDDDEEQEEQEDEADEGGQEMQVFA